MSPDLTLAMVPTSSTGVFPEIFLSSIGPRLGRGIPSWAVSPSTRRVNRRRIRSTVWIGNHLRSHIDRPKVEHPMISLGRTCTWKDQPKDTSHSCLRTEVVVQQLQLQSVGEIIIYL